MDKKNIDKRIIELIQQDENISYSKISQIVGIPEKDIEEKIKNFSDTREKILIVDDEMSTLMPLKRSLESENYAVVEAYDGHEAIKKANEEIPDLIILDLMLPGMDGIEVCQHLKTDTQTEKIPIIMLTAKDNINDKVEGLQIGAHDYVTKPFVLKELKARIKSVMLRSGNI
ncbi:MAG: response regulator [Candidatus Methanomarinus sp.]|uniref:Response regulator n=1 Tax=Candidatus Methanomarinus sp. TaxID=3386244 RepID=A0AC61SAG8_9EURY|nr:two-component system, OmpR family, alkaline phosphatase synthesis response regulator PhoP [ANME-2 cluster archaeon]PPA78921.1 MAG: response regulator PleD [ANME-2 cluster archaeon HR1]TKY91566.1 MAG: response regulator [ANME-2 cluster archaeon]